MGYYRIKRFSTSGYVKEEIIQEETINGKTKGSVMLGQKDLGTGRGRVVKIKYRGGKRDA